MVSTETTMPGFERLAGIFRRVRHRAAVGETRRLVAHHPHAVRQKFHVIVVFRFLHQRRRGGIDLAANETCADRFHRGALNTLDLA